MTEVLTADGLALDIFKKQREINDLVEEQDAMKEELKKIYENDKFQKVDTLLGYVSVVVSGGAKYSYADPDAQKRAEAFETVIDRIDGEKKELAAKSKVLTETAKDPKKALSEIQKKFGKKEIPADAKTSLRFVLNR